MEPLFTWRRRMYPDITHYWGDMARELLLAGAVLMLASAPLYADSLRTELPLEIVGAVLIVAFAAITNPFKRWVAAGDAVLGGTGAVIFQAWAMIEYYQVSGLVFFLREAIAIIFLFAFYFSLKTLRAMIMNQIGKPDSLMEFRRAFPREETPEEAQEEIAEAEHQAADPLWREEQIQEDDKEGD